nr:unnamed protein product [Callosobruchus analis]
MILYYLMLYWKGFNYLPIYSVITFYDYYKLRENH